MYDRFYPGQEWLDSDGNKIEAHGGTVFYENGTYYWIGEDKSHTSKKGKIWTWGVKCYCSKDLYNWQDEGHIIEPVLDNKKSIFHPNRRLDRPHLIFNENTNKYILWLKYNDKSHFVILSSDTILGPYKIIDDFYQPYNRKAGDFDLAVDSKTKKAYLYVELDHKDLIVCELNSEYTKATDRYTKIYENLNPPLSREAPAHFAYNNKHYLITSGMIGYVPNPSEVVAGKDWLGPYEKIGDITIDDKSCSTFNSQVSHVINVKNEDKYIYMADRWVPDYPIDKEKYESLYRAVASHYDKTIKASFRDMLTMFKSPMMGSADTSKSRYVWLPIEFENDIPHIKWYEQWKIED